MRNRNCSMSHICNQFLWSICMEVWSCNNNSCTIIHVLSHQILTNQSILLFNLCLKIVIDIYQCILNTEICIMELDIKHISITNQCRFTNQFSIHLVNIIRFSTTILVWFNISIECWNN